ncbi:MAG TPA: DUF2000 domain-containing protein [Burkholderiaceae bacterium]
MTDARPPAPDVPDPDRCVIVLDATLPPGRAANAAAVVALTVGQRWPGLVGAPLVDADGASHPGLIPIGIAVLQAEAGMMPALRAGALEAGCDVVDFPAQGQQTTSYAAFRDSVATLPADELRYVAMALVGRRKAISRLVGRLALHA